MKPAQQVTTLPLEIHRESYAVTRVVVSPASDDPVTIWMILGTPVAFQHKGHNYIGTILADNEAQVLLKVIKGANILPQLTAQPHSWRSKYAFHEQLEDILDEMVGPGNVLRLVDINDPDHSELFSDGSFPYLPFDPNLPLS